MALLQLRACPVRVPTPRALHPAPGREARPDPDPDPNPHHRGCRRPARCGCSVRRAERPGRKLSRGGAGRGSEEGGALGGAVTRVMTNRKWPVVTVTGVRRAPVPDPRRPTSKDFLSPLLSSPLHQHLANLGSPAHAWGTGRNSGLARTDGRFRGADVVLFFASASFCAPARLGPC